MEPKAVINDEDFAKRGGMLTMEEVLGSDEPMPISIDDDEKDY